MRVLITGGAGYLGTELTYKLSLDPKVKEVIVYDNFDRKNYNLFIGTNKIKVNNIRFVEGDILDSRKISNLLKDIDVVYHLAAKVSTPFSDQTPQVFEQTNNWGTAELVYAVEKSKVSRFIFLSSVAVYGASEDYVDVDSPLNPKTFYGISKMRAEEHITRLFEKIPAFIIRCGNVYGYSKSMRFDAVINRFMFDSNFKGQITVNGDGEQFRSFIHIDKVSHILAGLITYTPPINIFNLADTVISINEIKSTLQEIYPDLDVLYTNQHLKLREIKVKAYPQINGLYKLPKTTLKEELINFKESFTF